MLQLKTQSWFPDVIYAHTGWVRLFVKDVFPDVPLVGYFEYYYRTQGADLGFDPEFPVDLDVVLRCKVKNAVNLLSMEACDFGVTPLRWQAANYPTWFQGKLQVIHEGIDTDALQPKRFDTLNLPGFSGIDLSNTPVITFVNRNFEPTRGFHIMMRSLAHLQALVPQAHVIMVGGDKLSYGLAHESGKTYREMLTAELGASVNWTRVHFVGDLPYEQFIGMLQLATVHVYLSIPFVLSWSLLEAMAVGKAIVASNSMPVPEVLEHEKTALLTPFLEPQALAQNIARLVSNPSLRASLGQAARQHAVDEFDLRRVTLPKHLAMLAAIEKNKLAGALAKIGNF
ncbi:MAG: glycosyltransferase [Burkholderiales bacterium]|nr:glycosyltransferase [Burkholderiales bacterium]